MPELPDLEYVAGTLARTVVGRRITAARVGDPTVLRLMTEERFPAVLEGRRVASVERRGHFLRFALDGDLVLVVNAMLAGRYFLHEPGAAAPKKQEGLALALELDDGRALRYVDAKRMGKVYVARAAQEADIPGYRDLGVDVLSEAFTEGAFLELIARRRDQVRVFLMDKSALASIGNAYADEILFAARIHPKTFCAKLAPGERVALYQAIRRVLAEAIDEVARRGEAIDKKVRDFLAVRGRAGQPCRACGTTLRAVRVGASDSCFCPTCQPATRRLFIDWRKLDS